MSKSKVLVVGGTVYIGKRIVKASLDQGHPTYVLMRQELGFEIEKLQMLLSFKKQGAHLVEGSFSDHQSLVDAVKQVDVVICAMSGVQFRSHNILLQLKLVDAIKEAGNVKRFLPSEFGIDPSRMVSDVEYGKETFEDKIIVRKAIEDAKIPYTYISANGLGGYFVGNLSQFGSLVPPKERVSIYGDGNCKACFMDEDDVATYTIKTKWEKVSGKTLEKVHISKEDFLASMKLDMDEAILAALARIYHIFYEGCMMNFEIEDGEEAMMHRNAKMVGVPVWERDGNGNAGETRRKRFQISETFRLEFRL
ncbi:isoflavone reductase [Tanacetum coccineum]